MNIVVIGAGALGAYFGARLQEAGQSVQFLVRERRAKEIKENGLKVHSVNGDYTFDHPRVVQTVEKIENPDLVILAVKGYHLTDTLPLLYPLVDKGAKVLPVLNGMEHITILQSELGKDAVLGGAAYIISTLDEKGHVVHSSEMDTLLFGPLCKSQEPFCEELQSIVSTANIDGKNIPTIEEEMWRKYMFITAMSGVTTAGDFSIGTIKSCGATKELSKKVLEEMKDLANSYGTSLTEQDIEDGFLKLQSLPDQATSSMHQDMRKGLTLEVEHLQGGAIRLAKEAGIDIPHIETLYALIKPYEKGQVPL
ncbi:ketopantoate reductase family protein [Pseudalkalibacillus caeni]|uniref:2-dehydropantoate 2-reductase n=1 Tax=Exobacillus caeni TaxID=2574798 RepID=A0A5R9F439_9BACL|nr:ketopantoate reductase family protein [Pseudalkalibacillus caeni]TLS37269.1 ketopantoate reductase family protein [Pseudalkalibacillus caeni]